MAIATSTAIALALAAAASGASYYNSQNTLHKQDNAAADAIRAGAAKQKQADAQVNDLVNKTATSTTKDAADSSLSQYIKAMQANAGNANAGLSQQGNTSDAYKQGGADASLGIADYGSKMAGLMSRIDAPNLERQKEALLQGKYGTNLGLINRANQGDQYLADLRLRGIHRDAGLDAFSSFANGASGAMMGSGGYAGSSAGAGDQYVNAANSVYGGRSVYAPANVNWNTRNVYGPATVAW